MHTIFQLQDETLVFQTQLTSLPELGEAINLVDGDPNNPTGVTSYTVIAKGRFFINDANPNEYHWKVTITPVVQNTGN